MNSAPTKTKDFSDTQTSQGCDHRDGSFRFIHLREEHSNLLNRKSRVWTLELSFWHLHAQNRVVRDVSPLFGGAENLAEQVSHVACSFPCVSLFHLFENKSLNLWCSYLRNALLAKARQQMFA